MRNHLGVGLAFEHITGRFQLFAQFVVVFNNAVMHQGNAGFATTLAGKMRVGVVGGGCTVRCPARMRNSGKPGQRGVLHLAFQFRHTMRAAGALQVAVGMNGHAAGIVSAILQTFQAFQQYGYYITLRHSANNSAHRLFSLHTSQIRQWLIVRKAERNKISYLSLM